jgi:lysophospholipase L1-like esterase
MGGTNSMVDWVNSQPPLAQPDHAHFSPAGAKIIGKKLAQAIEQDYKDYMSLQE